MAPRIPDKPLSEVLESCIDKETCTAEEIAFNRHMNKVLVGFCEEVAGKLNEPEMVFELLEILAEGIAYVRRHREYLKKHQPDGPDSAPDNPTTH